MVSARFAWLVVVGAGACLPRGPTFGAPCASPADCGGGEVCVDARCQLPVPIAGEGEGEGDGGPVCEPACGTFQTCVADDVCDNNPGTDLCSILRDEGSIDFFDDQALVLDGVAGERFDFDNEDRFHVNRRLEIRDGMRIRVTVLDAPFEAVIYFAEDPEGVCDDVGPFFGSELAPFIPGERHIVVTSAEPAGTAGDGGTFTLRTRGILCDVGNAADDVTDSHETYDQCFRSFFENGAPTACENDANRCARDANNEFTGKFCAVDDVIHAPGTPIVRLDDGPGGPCCIVTPDCPDGPACPANCVP